MKCVSPPTGTTHWAKLINRGASGICLGFAEGHRTSTYCIFNFKTKTIILTKEVTFLQKSYENWSNVKKPVLVTTSYEGSDDKEVLKAVPVMYQNNYNYNVVFDSISDNEGEENLCDEDVDEEFKATPKITINAKVVNAVKKL